MAVCRRTASVIVVLPSYVSTVKCRISRPVGRYGGGPEWEDDVGWPSFRPTDRPPNNFEVLVRRLVVARRGIIARTKSPAMRVGIGRHVSAAVERQETCAVGGIWR